MDERSSLPLSLPRPLPCPFLPWPLPLSTGLLLPLPLGMRLPFLLGCERGDNNCHNETEARGEQGPHQSLCLACFDFHIAVRTGTKPSGRGEVQFASI